MATISVRRLKKSRLVCFDDFGVPATESTKQRATKNFAASNEILGFDRGRNFGVSGGLSASGGHFDGGRHFRVHGGRTDGSRRLEWNLEWNSPSGAPLLRFWGSQCVLRSSIKNARPTCRCQQLGAELTEATVRILEQRGVLLARIQKMLGELNFAQTLVMGRAGGVGL